MKFLTIATFKDTFSALPSSERAKHTREAVEHILEIKKKMGNQFNFYATVGWNRTVSIGEYSSIEEYYQTLQSPTVQYTDYESYALIEADEQYLKNALEQMNA